jgi:NAD(P)-dependent dehydrogenase (short-subunit alcohol dehydrogenase family)
MAETVLITGNRTPFGSTLIEHYLAGGHRVVATYPGQDQGPEPGAHAEEQLIPVVWTRRSAITAHGVLLEALKHCERIDSAVVLYEPAADTRALHEISAAETDRFFDTHLKSTVFIVRELLAQFEKQRGGHLSIALHSAASGLLSPFDACGSGGLRSFAGSLFSLYQNEPVVIDGFESRSADGKAFAEFVYRERRDSNGGRHGKWHRFGEKSVWNALGIGPRGR